VEWVLGVVSASIVVLVVAAYVIVASYDYNASSRNHTRS